ncbi:Na+/H+ antiporter subunit C [Paracoccus sp. TK19116]|uniref:Na+/H+ antiporter subunit C n=1 Tax=Paracoccus albicereus TaxID=2922394 RepID=A0ABT1MQH1_9RHOB|nr:Na+/H+ antiporter subunit C [Paracoccus albicereus]MCQ0970558.1 Na+/H+ antiporter subunit C [Paracoccus albicereus]
MEILVASAIGAMTAAGVYLILRIRTFAVVLGMTMLSYAINVFLFSTGRLVIGAAPILDNYAENPTYTDPLPQALVLTAIVISFGMTAVVVMMALGAFIEGGDDRIDMPDDDRIMPDLRTVEDEEARDSVAQPAKSQPVGNEVGS